MGSAFAHQIRRPEEAFRARRSFRRFIHETVVGIAAIVLPGAKLVAEPSQREPCALRHSHHMPAVGNRVTKGVNASPWLQHRLARRRENHAGRADGRTDRAGLDDAHPDRTSRLIASAGNDGNASAESGGASTLFGSPPCDFGRLVNFRQQLLVQL